LVTTGTSHSVTTLGTTYWYLTSFNPVTGCEGPPSPVTVTVTQSFTFTLSTTNVSCNGGSNGSATVTSITGGTGPFTFTWSGGTAGGNAIGMARTGFGAGNYSVTVSDAASCQAFGTFTITQPTALVLGAPSYSPAVVGPFNIGCFGGSTTITVNPSGGTPPYSYAWSPGGGSLQSNGVTAQTYTVTVTDANGCVVVNNYTPTQPTPVTSSSAVGYACNTLTNTYSSATVTVNGAGGVGPYTYSFNSGPFTSTNTFGTSVNGTVNYVVKDANACTAPGTASVTQIGQPVSSSDACNTIYVSPAGAGNIGSCLLHVPRW
jgi:hypothetical protein